VQSYLGVALAILTLGGGLGALLAQTRVSMKRSAVDIWKGQAEALDARLTTVQDELTEEKLRRLDAEKQVLELRGRIATLERIVSGVDVAERLEAKIDELAEAMDTQHSGMIAEMSRLAGQQR
jgi:hypothetical protein